MASLLAGAAPMSNDAGDPPSRTVWVAPTLVDGDVAPKAPEAFSSAFREGLERGGVGLRVSGSAAECVWDSACQADAARAVSADYAIWLSVRVDRRDYAIDVRVLEGGSGAVVAEASETCEVCGLAEAVAVVDSVAGAVVGRLDARDLEPPVLRFSSDPRAAVVRLDGAVVGETPFERPVEPGVHTVSAAGEREQQLATALHSVPLEHQILLELHYWEGMPTADLAEVLGIPRGTVKTRLFRARALVREALARVGKQSVGALDDRALDQWLASVREARAD